MVASAGILWSLQGLFFRQITEAGPWAILFWRSIGMLPVLFGFLLWRTSGRPFAAIRAVGTAGIFGGLSLVAAFGGIIFAIQVTTVANAVFLLAAAPLVTAILGWLLLGERVRKDTWMAILIALAGIFIMVRENLAGGALAGNIGALLSATGFAIFTVTLRWRKLADTLPVVLIGAVFAILLALLASAYAAQPLSVSVSDALWAMAMGAITLSGGMVLYTLGSRVMPAAELALLSLLEVMLAPVWVWIFLGETASVNTFVGGAVILFSVVLNGLIGARRPVLPGVRKAG
jgi:drug/metabolite transporter (DMT)-like permease